MKKHKIFLLLMAGLLAWSCSSDHIKLTPLASVTFKPTQSCELYTAKAPDRPFIEIALLAVGGKKKNRIELARQKAMSLGADAIVMKETDNVGALDVGNGVMLQYTRTIFVAIKWKEQ